MTLSDPAPRSPNAVDVAVGQKVRARRKQLKVTQTALAGAIGVTFQQVQKYEQGRNRVSASVLWAIACELKAPIHYFFSDLPVIAGFDPAEGSRSRERRLTEVFHALSKHEQEAVMHVVSCMLQARA